MPQKHDLAATERAILQAAAAIYAGLLASGSAKPADSTKLRRYSLQTATRLAREVDRVVQDPDEPTWPL